MFLLSQGEALSMVFDIDRNLGKGATHLLESRWSTYEFFF